MPLLLRQLTDAARREGSRRQPERQHDRLGVELGGRSERLRECVRLDVRVDVCVRVAGARWPFPDGLPERVSELGNRVREYYESGENPKQRGL